jgi:hypothetical protein
VLQKNTAKQSATSPKLKASANKHTTTTLTSITNDIRVVPDIQTKENVITATKRKMEIIATEKKVAKRTKSTTAVNVEEVQQMQHEILQLKEQNEKLQNDQVEIAKKVASKKSNNKKIVLNNDETSLEDMTVDYTKPENYSVKQFVGHHISLREGKGPPIIALKATWKGYASTAPTDEQWGNMKKFHKRQLLRYGSTKRLVSKR